MSSIIEKWKLFTISFLVFLMCSCTSTYKNQRGFLETKAIKEYYSSALQGDVKSAANLLISMESPTLLEMDLYVKYKDRFIDKVKPQLKVEDQFVLDVIYAYQDYWTEILTQELSEREGFYLLFKNLNKVLEPKGKKVKVYDDQRLKEISDLIKEELGKRGYYSLNGMTRPHLELMVWKKQKNKTYKVKLHDGAQKVKVVLLDNFQSLGWSAYATFGKSFTGGWATKEKLFCVKPAYKLRSEKYKVSYLKHEARHFADYKLLPNLKQPELEYRAKLTELIYANKTLFELIEKFKNHGESTRVSPHAFANFHVYENLLKELKLKPGFKSIEQTKKSVVKEAALKLLEESSVKFKTGDLE